VVGIEPLAYYTLELARPPDGWGRLQELSAHARQASEQMQRDGIQVRFLRSIFVPEDETCFHLYEAASAENVREAARLAELPFESVVEGVNEPRAAR
jgi:Protein of unknown function (DUF4242)